MISSSPIPLPDSLGSRWTLLYVEVGILLISIKRLLPQKLHVATSGGEQSRHSSSSPCDVAVMLRVYIYLNICTQVYACSCGSTRSTSKLSTNLGRLFTDSVESVPPVRNAASSFSKKAVHGSIIATYS